MLHKPAKHKAAMDRRQKLLASCARHRAHCKRTAQSFGSQRRENRANQRFSKLFESGTCTCASTVQVRDAPLLCALCTAVHALFRSVKWVAEISPESSPWKREAFAQEASEAYLVGIFEDACVLRRHSLSTINLLQQFYTNCNNPTAWRTHPAANPAHKPSAATPAYKSCAATPARKAPAATPHVPRQCARPCPRLCARHTLPKYVCRALTQSMAILQAAVLCRCRPDDTGRVRHSAGAAAARHFTLLTGRSCVYHCPTL